MKSRLGKEMIHEINDVLNNGDARSVSIYTLDDKGVEIVHLFDGIHLHTVITDVIYGCAWGKL